MSLQLPPKPRGDLDGTWRAIHQLEDYRKGIEHLRTAIGDLRDGTHHLSGMYLLPVDTYRASGSVEMAVALAGIDKTIASMRAAANRLGDQILAWSRECDRLRAAAAEQ